MGNIDLSTGQQLIVRDLVGIYQKSLTGIMDDLYAGKLSKNIEETINLLSGDPNNKDTIIKSFEEDFFKYCDANADPNSVMKFGVMDLIIIKFILTQWYKEEDMGWNDLDVANLLIKMDFLIDNMEN